MSVLHGPREVSEKTPIHLLCRKRRREGRVALGAGAKRGSMSGPRARERWRRIKGCNAWRKRRRGSEAAGGRSGSGGREEAAGAEVAEASTSMKSAIALWDGGDGGRGGAGEQA